MSRRRLLAFLAVFAQLAVGVLFLRSGCSDARPRATEGSSTVYDPRSYYQLVNTAIAPHLDYCPLYADTTQFAGADRTDAELQALLDRVTTENGGTPEVSTDDGDGTSPACDCGSRRISAWFCLRDEAERDRIERYARMSPLGEDLAIPSRWRKEWRADGSAGGSEEPRVRVELTEGIHRQPLPGSRMQSQYEGTIYYRPAGPGVVLVDGGGNERLIGGGKGTVRADMDEWRKQQERAVADGPRRFFFHGDALGLYRAGSGSLDDRITLKTGLGADPLLVIVKQRTGDFGVSIDGAPLRSDDVRWILGLHPLQEIDLRWERHEPLMLRVLDRRAGVLSEMRFAGREGKRVFDEESGIDDYVRRYAELCPGRPLSLEIIVTQPRIFAYQDPKFWDNYRQTPAWEFARFVKLVESGKARPKQPPAPKEFAAERERQDLEASLEYTKKLIHF